MVKEINDLGKIKVLYLVDQEINFISEIPIRAIIFVNRFLLFPREIHVLDILHLVPSQDVEIISNNTKVRIICFYILKLYIYYIFLYVFFFQEDVQEPLRGDQGDIIAQDSDNGDYDDSNTNQKSKEGTRVPIIVSIMLIAIYIFGGAMLFTLWEQDWDYLIGSYFCFITLSTIGFGDFVPGTSHDSWKNQEKLILCALYLVFGLALIAMCFDLMQEEVKAKCLWLGQRLGILDAEN